MPFKCRGCGREVDHKMCVAYGTPYYCTGLPFTEDVEARYENDEIPYADLLVVAYDEPAIPEGDSHIEISAAQAIQRQRLAGLQRNYEYKNDREALEDFMSVHWAYIERGKHD